MKRVFITGISGLMGASVALGLPKDVQVIGCYNTHAIDFRDARIQAVKLDLLDLAKSREIITQFKPDAVIHTAAITAVDWSETHREETHKGNVTATENITAIAKELNCKLVHVSTDAVFDGTNGNYAETDATNPVNVYSKTKLLAEQAALKHDNTIVMRTTMYGWNYQDKTSVAEWMIANFEQKKQVNGFTDCFFTPVLVNRFANIITHLCDKNFKGIIHIGSKDSISKHDFALLIADVFGFDKSLVVKASLDAVSKIPRPKNTALNTALAQKLGVPLTTVKEDLIVMKRLRNTGFVEQLKQLRAQ
jgi:dTDP-4-dehydrorhamnose reductase